MPLAGSCELQLSKGIGRVFRGVLGTAPVVYDSRAEIVTKSHRGMGISRTTTLAKFTSPGKVERNRNEDANKNHSHTEMWSRGLTVPGRILYIGGADSFLEDSGYPTLETFSSCQ